MRLQTRELTRMALYIALFIALDWFSGNVLPTMPQGGSLGLSTIVLIIASYDLGFTKAIVLNLVALAVSHLFDAPWFVSWPQYLLDYSIGYAAYSVARYFGNEKNMTFAVVVPNAIRFFSSAVAGVLYYGVPWLGSFLYQAGYIVPTMIVSMIVLPVLLPRLRDNLNSENIPRTIHPVLRTLGYVVSIALVIVILWSALDAYQALGWPGIFPEQ